MLIDTMLLVKPNLPPGRYFMQHQEGILLGVLKYVLLRAHNMAWLQRVGHRSGVETDLFMLNISHSQ